MKRIYMIICAMTVALLIVVGLVLLLTVFNQSSAAVPLSNKPKLVIDHDGGADDALAITMSLLYEAYFDGPEVVALTAVNGNVNQTQVVTNSFRILELVDRIDVPIYAGAEGPIVHGIQSDYYFGLDGLGDTGYVMGQPVEIEDQHAAVGLLELSKQYEGELIVMAIGPLTNIALAIKMDPDFVSRLAHLYIGAGDIYNELTSPHPEFNADIDPEAYYIVAGSSKAGKVTFVPFSQIQTSLNITNSWRSDVLGAIETPTMKTLNTWEQVSFVASSEWTLLDPAVAAIVLNDTIVDEFRSTSNGIVLCGDHRGINTNNFTSIEPNGRMVYTADIENYKELLIRIYSAELV